MPLQGSAGFCLCQLVSSQLNKLYDAHLQNKTWHAVRARAPKPPGLGEADREGEEEGDNLADCNFLSQHGQKTFVWIVCDSRGWHGSCTSIWQSRQMTVSLTSAPCCMLVLKSCCLSLQNLHILQSLLNTLCLHCPSSGTQKKRFDRKWAPSDKCWWTKRESSPERAHTHNQCKLPSSVSYQWCTDLPLQHS